MKFYKYSTTQKLVPVIYFTLAFLVFLFAANVDVVRLVVSGQPVDVSSDWLPRIAISSISIVWLVFLVRSVNLYSIIAVDEFGISRLRGQKRIGLIRWCSITKVMQDNRVSQFNGRRQYFLIVKGDGNCIRIFDNIVGYEDLKSTIDAALGAYRYSQENQQQN